MTSRTQSLFQSSMEKTDAWLGDVMHELGYDDPAPAYSCLRAVLHVLRDRLTPGEAADLSANLPMLIRGVYFEGWRPAAEKPERYRHKEEFLERVAAQYTRLQDDAEVEKAVGGVFRVLARHIPEGEIGHIKSQLPEDIRSLWPSAATA